MEQANTQSPYISPTRTKEPVISSGKAMSLPSSPIMSPPSPSFNPPQKKTAFPKGGAICKVDHGSRGGAFLPDEGPFETHA